LRSQIPKVELRKSTSAVPAAGLQDLTERRAGKKIEGHENSPHLVGLDARERAHMLPIMCVGNSSASPSGDGSTANLNTWFDILEGDEQVFATLPDTLIRRPTTVEPERPNRAVRMSEQRLTHRDRRNNQRDICLERLLILLYEGRVE
jgi:hypothetical protein